MHPLKAIIYRSVISALRQLRAGNSADPPSVVLFKPDRIGDFVLATGIICHLAEYFHDKPLVLVTSTLVAPLARREFPDVRVIDIPLVGDAFRGGLLSGYNRSFNALSAINPGILISLRYHPTLYEDVLLSCLSKRQKTTVQNKQTECKLPGECLNINYGSEKNEIGGSSDFLRFRKFQPYFSIRYPNKSENHPVPLEVAAHYRMVELVTDSRIDVQKLNPKLKSFPVHEDEALLVLPFGSDTIRSYPSELLLRAIVSANLPTNVRIVFCGEKAKREQLNELCCALSKKAIFSVGVETPESVVELTERVASARCVLTMESAGAHLATAMNKRAVIIIGGGHFGLFGPWTQSDRQRWLFERMDCFNCDWQCRHDRSLCIHNIDPETVGRHLSELWRGK